MHHAAEQKFDGDLWGLLLEAVKNGELHAFDYINLMDILDPSINEYSPMILHQIGTNYYRPKFSKENLAKNKQKKRVLRFRNSTRLFS